MMTEAETMRVHKRLFWIVPKINQLLILKENIEAIQRKKQSFLLENGQFKLKKPKERITDSYRSTMGYTFLSNNYFSIDKIQKKYYFSYLNRPGPPTPSHPTF